MYTYDVSSTDCSSQCVTCIHDVTTNRLTDYVTLCTECLPQYAVGWGSDNICERKSRTNSQSNMQVQWTCSPV